MPNSIFVSPNHGRFSLVASCRIDGSELRSSPTTLKQDLFQQKLSQSMSNTICGPQDEESEGCRDADYALILKLVAIAAILAAGVCGVAIPIFGKKRRIDEGYSDSEKGVKMKDKNSKDENLVKVDRDSIYGEKRKGSAQIREGK